MGEPAGDIDASVEFGWVSLGGTETTTRYAAKRLLVEVG